MPNRLAFLPLLLPSLAAPALAQPPSVTSYLQIVATPNSDSAPVAQPTTVYHADAYFEAPNWTRDGHSLLFDQGGRIMQVPASGGTPVALNVGAATRCNGSHGLSPDGNLLAITCNMPGLTGAHVFLIPVAGGEPRPLTQTNGSYWHSWSPDGKTILFTHPDSGSLNIFSVSVDAAGAGTNEHAITTGTGVSDDPDFSADGRYIYFCSDRTGTTQIWRMKPDGSSPEQITNDDRANWTPHPSPDGRHIVYISYPPGTAGHPANRNVTLRLMSLPDLNDRDLTSLTGGSGTMNVPSWSPDGKGLAFVSYRVNAAPATPTAPAAPVVGKSTDER